MTQILKISAAGCVVLICMVLLTGEMLNRIQRANMAKVEHIQSWSYPDYRPPTKNG